MSNYKETWKVPIIAWVIIRQQPREVFDEFEINGKKQAWRQLRQGLWANPILVDFEGMTETEDIVLEDGHHFEDRPPYEELYKIIPAFPGCFVVYGYNEETKRTDELGYEFPGLPFKEPE